MCHEIFTSSFFVEQLLLVLKGKPRNALKYSWRYSILVDHIGHAKIFLTERIVYFLNTVHCYNLLEEYCYYEIQRHKALCEFAVEKGYCWLKEGLPPRHIRE
jgi:hypothetical protein